MKRPAYKTIVVVTLACVLTLIAVGIVLAGSKTKTGTIDGRSWTARLGIGPKNPYDWKATAYAHMNPGPRSPMVVGWYWWTTREYCGSTIVYQRLHGGAMDTSPPYDTMSAYYIDVYHTSCSNHYLSSYARFDFKSGSQTAMPQFEYKERRNIY